MSASTSPAESILARRPNGPKFNGSLSRAVDHAAAELEAADPATVEVWRRLADELERLALAKEAHP